MVESATKAAFAALVTAAERVKDLADLAARAQNEIAARQRPLDEESVLTDEEIAVTTASVERLLRERDDEHKQYLKWAVVAQGLALERDEARRLHDEHCDFRMCKAVWRQR